MPKNKYGYEVNIQNPVLQAWYESYKRRIGIHYAPSDKQRLEWEKKVKAYIKRQYKSFYRCELRDADISDFTRERVEQLVAVLGDKKI